MKNPQSTNYSLQTRQGFTLIELLLYLGLAAVMMLIIVLFLGSILESRIKNQTVAEVEQQGAQVLHRITQAARNADSITSPTAGANASSLSLTMASSTINPTVFDVSGNVIRITEGVGSAAPLTNSRVTASALTFKNISRASTPGTIRVQFTLTHVNPEGRNEYSFAKTFYSSASLR